MKKKILLIIFSVYFSIYTFAQFRVFTIGDSTVQDYNEGYSPRKGWGQMLPFFFDVTGVTVTNKAVGGTSSKSFYTNHWAAVRDNLKTGDYVFIQFGINDRNSADPLRYAPAPTIFKDYIRLFVSETRAKGAIPILVTTVRRNAWTAEGVPYDSYHDHPVAMRELAKELNTPLVDLDERCRELFVEQGQVYASRHITMNLVSGEYPNYKNGNTDDVHYQETGATDIARYVCDAIKNSANNDLKKLVPFLKPLYKVTVNINDKSKAQTLTRTTYYPQGINVTMKTIPRTGAKFMRWENASNTSVSTLPIYQFKMGNAETSYTAVYESNIVSDEIIIDNIAKTLSSPSASKYQWFFNNALMNGATNASVSIVSNGTYSVKMMDASGKIIKTLSICVTIGKDGVIRKIYIIGDSTVSTYKEDKFPMAGWGQVLSYFFNNSIQITNAAIGGRSSRSFWEEGRWTPIYNALQPGDYVLIQFGHNDRDYSKPERYTSVADYKTYITQYVQQTKDKGAIPILVSPMVMNAWAGTTMRNVFAENGNDYRGAMAAVAAEQKVIFVDLNMKSFNFFKTLTPDYCSRFYYNTYPAGEYPNYPDGLTDGTHFQENGALANARWIIEGINESDDEFACALQKYVKPMYSVSVNADIQNPGSISQTLKYPEGCPVTVKVLPSANNTFLFWNKDNINVATTNIHRFILAPANTTLTAKFTNSIPTDCAGVSGGAAYLDKCGVCVGGNTGKVACVADCNGDANGTATTDNCGICSGGKTGITPCLGAIQAEDFCDAVGVVETTHAGYIGEGYLNFNNEIGASASWKIYSETALAANIAVRYANGTTTARSMNISVNEIQQALFTGASTTNWTTYQTEALTLNLSKGINNIVFVSTTANGGPNIDAFILNNVGIKAFDCDSVIEIPSVKLKAGWNIIGCPLLGSTDLTIALKSILNYVVSVKDSEKFYHNANPEYLNTLKKLDWGKGYMIYVSQPCDLYWGN